jgi:translation initiation factor 6
MITFNSNVAIVPHSTDETEAKKLEVAGLEVFRIDDNLSAWGNLVSANDRGAIFSKVVPKDLAKIIAKELMVDYDFVSPMGYKICGSFIASSNRWAIVSKLFSEDEVSTISDVLKVKAAVGSVNGGLNQIKVGALVSDHGILLGKSTTGPEILEIQSVLH